MREISTSVEPPRRKLGVALAGGGFRASLFHLGVLRRMAELDLLRRVEVLSTVSGGSVVGALYALLLKKRLEASADADLSRHEYVALVREMESLLRDAVQRNLRTRLFTSPVANLRLLLTPYGLGQRMSRLLERELYAPVVDELRRESDAAPGPAGGRFRLRELHVRPAGRPLEGGIDAYNRAALAEGRSVVTRLVLNATALNSGVRFWFSGAELGDRRLGYVRRDEVDALLARKELLEDGADGDAPPPGEEEATAWADVRALAEWWRSGRPRGQPARGRWRPLFELAGFPGALVDAEPGALRQAKLAAWHLRVGLQRGEPTTGGLDAGVHRELFWASLSSVDAGLAGRLRAGVAGDPDLRARLEDFVRELYLLRSAELVSGRVGEFWDELPLADAVAASATFPPVFPPFTILGLYDDLHVSRLGLTDGGVLDNVGLTALAEARCSHVVASDTSGLFATRERAASGRLGMTGRIVSILMQAVARLQRGRLRRRRRLTRQVERNEPADPGWSRFLVSDRLDGLAFFHVQSPPVDPAGGSEPAGPPPLEPTPVRHELAALRTDMDAFGDLEVAALADHGYGTADRYLRRYLPGAVPTEARAHPPAPPFALDVDPDRLRRVLEVGRSRAFRALKLGAWGLRRGTWLSWTFLAAVAAALLGATWKLEVSIRAAVDAAAELALTVAAAPLAVLLGPGWTDVAVPVGPLLAVLVLAVLLVPRVTGVDPVARLREAGRPRLARRLATALKRTGPLVGNLLWLVGALPLAAAVVGSALAWISDLFFSRPFLRATRLPGMDRRPPASADDGSDTGPSPPPGRG